ncbi:hypothetical protein [Scytonema sp. PCC 10023]|uniref:hypothetical protein n=1 Tax=Scytonema sp. PCC 10023 TaxID=1680591 RepID=UPI0039C64F90
MIELSNKLFGVQPNIFYRVLFWVICGKANTSNFPLLNIQTLIYGILVCSKFNRTMIAGSIPNQGNTAFGKLGE